MKMSAEAENAMIAIAKKYAERGFPNHNAWSFDIGNQKQIHAELRALGLMEHHGTSASRLSAAGRNWVMENREDI